MGANGAQGYCVLLVVPACPRGGRPTAVALYRLPSHFRLKNDEQLRLYQITAAREITNEIEQSEHSANHDTDT
jgi:hypothetical protein